VELEDAEKWFQSEQFQANYQAYVMESEKIKTKLELEELERQHKRAEYEASPEFIINQELEKARQIQRDMQNAVKADVMQVLHDALVRAGAKCSDDGDDCRCY
jgi:hypothetical protein